MEALHATTSSTEPTDQLFDDSRDPDLETFLSNVNTYAGVCAEPQPRAACCGAQGCSNRKHLAHLRIEDFGQRVLCPVHVVQLVNREAEQPQDQNQEGL